MQIVPDMLTNGAKRAGDLACVSDGTSSYSFRETDERASRLAWSLRNLGLQRGDRVALLAMNELEYTEIQVASQRAGLILVPLNYRLAVPELQYLVDDSSPSLLIHGPGFADHAEALDVVPTVHLGDAGHGSSYNELLDSAAGTIAAGPVEPEAPCVILYTSGTTGRPKGAVLSNMALWARINSSSLEFAQQPGDSLLQCLPLFHIASNVGYAFSYMNATNIFVKTFDPTTIFEHLERDRPTYVLLVPTMINMLLNHPDIATSDWSSVRTIIYGASTISPDVLARAIDVMGCDFVQMFGMTETSGCTVLRPNDHDPINHPEWLASAGTGAAGFETLVVGSDDVELPPGEVGEIVTRGPAVMTEYWANPDASAEALRNGWMHTGDAGYRGEDGYVYVTDRFKDMIVSGGENIYPREVEDVLFAHEAILEAAVIGIPSERWGEQVHAIVVLHDGVDVAEQSLLEYTREHLASYKLPRSVAFVDALPKNVTGKILKTELRAPYWEAADRSVR